jgi:hypothetical protein
MRAGGLSLPGQRPWRPAPQPTAALPVSGRAAPSLALVNYPTSKLANLRDLKVNEPREISYPDADSRACS